MDSVFGLLRHRLYGNSASNLARHITNLSKTCQNIFEGPLGIKVDWCYPREHHHSANNGCFICDILWRAIHRRYIKAIEAYPSASIPRLSTISPTYQCFLHLNGEAAFLEFWGALASDNALERICLTPTNEFASLLSGSAFSVSTGSEEVLKVAKKWLQECLNGHETCQKKAEVARFPTRLLELEFPVPGRVTLFNTSDRSIKGPYMTLSHCWGSAKFLKLEENTCRILYSGFPETSLPQTFRDAVRIALRLKVKYLWIDSICILQDSPEDWRYEASAMADIYKGSLCNISAASAEDSSKGCFYERLPGLIKPCVIQSKWTDIKNEEYHLHKSSPWYVDFDQYPLFTRGWVLQERASSPRVLHFGAQQLFWECSEVDASETYPEGFPAQVSPEYFGFKRDRFLSPARLNMSVVNHVTDLQLV